MDSLAVYNKIRFVAKQRRISIELLAYHIGMTKQGLYAAMTNDSLKLNDFLRIAEVLDVHPAYLLENTEELEKTMKNRLATKNKLNYQISDALNEVQDVDISQFNQGVVLGAAAVVLAMLFSQKKK